MRSKLLTILGAALALALTTTSFAQRTTGGISGTVKDATGAVLPGVTVSVSGPAIVGSQSAVTNEHGFYRILNLPPGEYQVNFTLSGFKIVTLRDLRVGVGATLEQNAALEMSQLQETIEVVGDSTVVDTTSSEVASNYDREWVENAPLRRFSFFDLVAAAPGAMQGGDGSARTMMYGSGYDENAFQVDGVDITDNFFNEALAEPNTDAIEEVEILALGAPAEYGNATGAVYNIVTRQGSNEFHGDVNYFWQGDGLTSNNTEGLTNPDGSFTNACASGEGRCPWLRDKYNDFTAQIGGPIIRDKLWFFASYQYQRDSNWDIGIDATGPESNLTLKNYPTDRYLGKLTWQITPKHKLVGNFHYDKQRTDNGLDIGSTPSTAWSRRADTPTPGLAYTGVLSDKTVLDVRFSGFYGNVSGEPTDPNEPRSQPRFYDLDTGLISGGHYYWYDVEPRRTTATAKISHLADNFLGSSHDFKFGVQYSGAVARGIYGYNDFVYIYSLSYPGYGFGYDRTPFSYTGDSRSIGVFLDDDIKVSDRFSLSLGVRYDYNKAYAAAQDDLDEFGNPTGVTYPQIDYYTWNTIVPRIGFNWKITGDGKTVLKGFLGRYHRAVATGEYANVISPSAKDTFSGPFDTTTGQFYDTSFFEGPANLGVDPDYKAPRMDQFALSLERELARGLGVMASYTYKRGRDYAGWEDTTGQYVQEPFTDNIGDDPSGRTFNIYRLVSDPGARAFRITNPPDVGSDVHAATLTILKRMTGKWSLNASATYLNANGRVQESRSGVTLQQRSGLQFRDFGKNPNDFVNTDGPLVLDIPWVFKVQAMYQLPAGFLVSGNFSHRAGPYIVRRATLPEAIIGAPEGRLMMLQPRGELGRIPSVTFLDLRLQKDFKLSERVRFSIFADGLNLLNEDAYEGVQSSTATSSVFLWPFDPVDPRRIMLGAKLRF
jgi:outer membrane receptor protein involved in Fe transport